jgi:hypothetical protein
MDVGNAAPHISLRTSTGRVGMATSLMVAVQYTNASNREMHFREPAKRWETRLQIRGEEGEPHEVRLGRLTRVRTQHGSRVVVEPANDIDLPPGGRFEFELDVGEKWPELLPPGRHFMRIVDELWDPPARSEEAEVTIVCDAATPPRLFALLRDTQRGDEARRFAATWLDALNPDLNLREAMRGSAEALHSAIRRSEAWWRQQDGNSQVLARLSALSNARSRRA